MSNLRANRIVSTTGSNAITGSVFFDGNDDLVVPDSDDFHLNGNYTIECFINRSLAPASEVDFISKWGGSDKSFLLYINSSGKFGYAVSNDGTNVTNYGAGNTVIGAHEWHHLAVTNDGTTVRIFVNGILEQSGATVTMFNSTRNLVIGAETSQGSYDLQGFISNLRIIKGTALYTSNFIPPTSKLKNLPGTVLLCCQDNESVTTEATGKTITANGDPTATRFTPQVGSDGGLVFDGVTKVNTQNYFYLPTGTTEQREPIFPGGNVGGSARGLFGGGYSPTFLNTIDYITIQSTGNAFDFGDLTTARIGPGACASSTRGVWGGGRTPTVLNTIDYATISSTGNALDFGDISSTYYDFAGLSNSVRGVFAGNTVPGSTYGNIIEYITIASTGNSQDFGDLTAAKSICGSCASPTRGIFAGGNPSPSSAINTIEFIQIQTQGIAKDFGDLTTPRLALSGCSSTTRGIFAAGYNAPANVNVIDYITISTQSNALDFGDLSYSPSYIFSCSSSTRGVFAGGNSPAKVNTIEYVTIASISYSTDFGDLTGVRAYGSACSNGHGGLG